MINYIDVLKGICLFRPEMYFMDFLRRAWVEIDLNSLKQNYSSICRECKTNVIPVVKADAYGHGAPMVALALQDCGASLLPSMM